MDEKPGWLRAHGKPWVRGPAKVVYDNPWIRVTEYAATAPTGNPATYGLVSYKNLAIAVLPLFDDGATVLVGQHRFPLMEYSWEIPEGGVADGETLEEGCRRELREETGYTAARWRQLSRISLSNSVTDERGALFVAQGLTAGEATPDGSEELELRWDGSRAAIG